MMKRMGGREVVMKSGEIQLSLMMLLVVGGGVVELLVLLVLNVERPRTRRRMWSMCWRAAVVVGEEGSDWVEIAVAADASGRGM